MTNTMTATRWTRALKGRWLARDRSKQLRIEVELTPAGEAVRVSVLDGDGQEVLMSARHAKAEPGLKLALELGDEGLGATYTLQAIIDEDLASMSAQALTDALGRCELLGKHGASFYEAVLGYYDDYVEALNEADAWSRPPTRYRRME